MPVFALYDFIFDMPGSTTKKIPSIVSEASAMFVATMHLRQPGGGGSKIIVCISEGRAL